MIHVYQPADTTKCLSNRRVVFIGDSVTRKLFFQFANILDDTLPLAPPADDQKHSDHSLLSGSGTKIDFFWDPFLNSSHVKSTISGTIETGGRLTERPAVLFFGSGLWYLRYADTSGGLPEWLARIESTLEKVANTTHPVADEIFVAPIEEVIPSKLSRERATTIHPSDIDLMNSDLYHRISLASQISAGLLGTSARNSSHVSLPLVFNRMLDADETEDGLHFSDTIVRAQANVLLNHRCNDVLPKHFPMDKTCCRRYPWPSFLQTSILFAVIAWAPVTWYLSRWPGMLSISAAVSLLLTAEHRYQEGLPISKKIFRYL